MSKQVKSFFAKILDIMFSIIAMPLAVGMFLLAMVNPLGFLLSTLIIWTILFTIYKALGVSL